MDIACPYGLRFQLGKWYMQSVGYAFRIPLESVLCNLQVQAYDTICDCCCETCGDIF